MTRSEDLYGREHVERYRATNGDEGYVWKRGATILLLTTTGRRSGESRVQPLIYRDVDGKPVIVASKGGAPEHPAWYLNLREHPEVEVQIKGEVFGATARVVEGDERARLWDRMVEVWPPYADYQRKTDREIPVVVLERTA
jgi:deazaflavin-dependent oxidoreductase (nitroreductase family)